VPVKMKPTNKPLRFSIAKAYPLLASIPNGVYESNWTFLAELLRASLAVILSDSSLLSRGVPLLGFYF